MNASTPTIVLIHGGFVDGSGWEGVYDILTKDGYCVAVVQKLRRPRSPMTWHSPSA